MLLCLKRIHKKTPTRLVDNLLFCELTKDEDGFLNFGIVNRKSLGINIRSGDIVEGVTLSSERIRKRIFKIHKKESLRVVSVQERKSIITNHKYNFDVLYDLAKSKLFNSKRRNISTIKFLEDSIHYFKLFNKHFPNFNYTYFYLSIAYYELANEYESESNYTYCLDERNQNIDDSYQKSKEYLLHPDFPDKKKDDSYKLRLAVVSFKVMDYLTAERFFSDFYSNKWYKNGFKPCGQACIEKSGLRLRGIKYDESFLLMYAKSNFFINLPEIGMSVKFFESDTDSYDIEEEPLLQPYEYMSLLENFYGYNLPVVKFLFDRYVLSEKEIRGSELNKESCIGFKESWGGAVPVYVDDYVERSIELQEEIEDEAYGWMGRKIYKNWLFSFTQVDLSNKINFTEEKVCKIDEWLDSRQVNYKRFSNKKWLNDERFKENEKKEFIDWFNKYLNEYK